MTIEIRDEDTAALVHLLAEHNGTDAQTAIAQAVTAKLDALGIGYTSYRERRNARVKLRAWEARQPVAPAVGEPAN